MTGPEVAKLSRRVESHDDSLRAIADTTLHILEVVDEHTAMLVDQAGVLEGHTAMLVDQAGVLEGHTVVLADQAGVLEGHTVVLADHTRRLESIDHTLGEHGRALGDLQESQAAMRVSQAAMGETLAGHSGQLTSVQESLAEILRRLERR